jgi:hypothetical protein
MKSLFLQKKSRDSDDLKWIVDYINAMAHTKDILDFIAGDKREEIIDAAAGRINELLVLGKP